MDTVWKTLEWPELGVRCPRCGNDGRPGAWERNGSAPFRITEQVARLWDFVPQRTAGSPLVLVVDGDSEKVDWESGSGLKLLCMGCFAELEISDELEVDFG